MQDDFASGSLQHLLALAGVVAVALLAGQAGRVAWLRRDGLLLPRVVLAVVLAACYSLFSMYNVLVWQVPLRECLPLHLCDMVLIAACVALVRRKQAAYEFTYFYGLGGTTQALLTPELASGFPSFEFLAFFGAHGGIVAALSLLTFGCGLRPRPGAWRWIVAAGYAYLIVVGLANALLGTNYGYLCAKPDDPSLLDYLGPWPWYLVSLQAIGLALIFLLYRLAKMLHTRSPSRDKFVQADRFDSAWADRATVNRSREEWENHG